MLRVYHPFEIFTKVHNDISWKTLNEKISFNSSNTCKNYKTNDEWELNNKTDLPLKNFAVSSWLFWFFDLVYV